MQPGCQSIVLIKKTNKNNTAELEFNGILLSTFSQLLLSQSSVNSGSVGSSSVNSSGSVNSSNLSYGINGSLISGLVSVTTTCYEQSSNCENKCNLFHF